MQPASNNNQRRFIGGARLLMGDQWRKSGGKRWLTPQDAIFLPGKVFVRAHGYGSVFLSGDVALGH